MSRQQTIPGNSTVYYRLIALWVVAEALLGGIIHGFKIPVSGLVVGSCAVVCVCLIGWYAPGKGAILKATIIVAVFKMMLSPQAPPTAYIAVFFQGLLGELLFRKKKFYRVSCFVLAILSLLESALQRILVLTIVYGNDFWQAVNEFITRLTGQKELVNYSFLIGAGYVLLHAVAGLLVGWWASVLPGRIAGWAREHRIQINEAAVQATPPRPVIKKKRRKRGLFIVWIILSGLYVQSYFGIGAPLLPAHVSLKILLRSLVIVLGWYFLVRPLAKRWLDRWLEKKKGRMQSDIRQVWQLLPAMQALVAQGWRQAPGRGWKRLTAAGRMILAGALAPGQRKVFLLTGPIQTGKTTSLVNWSEQRGDVYGILMPVVAGKRVFMDAHTREQFPVEAVAGETNTISIGRYVFSGQAFDRAGQLIRDAAQHPGWLVIDEIGPLELEQKGFYTVLKEIVQHSPAGQRIVLVVREGLTERVKEVFGLEGATIINDIGSVV